MLKVIGLGNMLRGDDSIGPIIIKKLSAFEKKSFSLIDAGSDAFTVLEHLIEKDPVLIIDCAKMGKQPGEVVKFEINHANIRENENMVSLHGFGFADVYKMAKEIGPVASCKIIAVEPKYIEFDKKLSEEVKESIPKILKMVNEEAKKHA